MHKVYSITIFILCFISPLCQLNAQEILTPQHAIALALDKNFDIILAKNEAEIAKINNNSATAGMLPKINATAGDGFNLNNINQKFTTGQSVNKDWVPVNNASAGINLDWAIFDGMKMFATKDKLNALQALGDLQWKDQILNTIATVLTSYYDLVRQKQQIKALEQSLAISKERVKLSQQKYEVGYSDKTPLLQAKVDDAQLQINILKIKTQLNQSKILFNQLIGTDISTQFEVVDTIVINDITTFNTLKDSAMYHNFSIQSAQKNIEIAQFQKKEINALRLPSIKFNTGYSFSQNNSKAGLILYNRAYGPYIGLNASITIFNGGIVKKQLQVADISIAIQQIKLNQIQNDLQAKVTIAYKKYTDAQSILDLSETSVEFANENVTITLNRFRLNQANSVEMKQAQGSYEDALYNVILARYNLKIAEIELQKLSNELSQN